MQNDPSGYYFKQKKIIFFVNFALTLAFLFIMAFSFSRGLREVVRSWTESSIIVISLYFFLFYIFYFLFTFAPKFYEGVVLKNRIQKQKVDFRQWIDELARQESLAFAILLIFIQIVYFFLESDVKLWWLPSAIVIIIARNIFDFFPAYIVPAISRSRKLKDTALKQRLIKLAQKANIKISDIYLYSGNTQKATLLGTGISRRLMLSDKTENFAPEEIEVIFAREIAAHVKGYSWIAPALDAVSILLTFFIAGIFMPPAIEKFGFEFVFDVETLPVLLGLLFIGFAAIQFVINSFKRKIERETDILTLKLSQAPDAFISLLVRHSQETIDNLHPVYFFKRMLKFEPSLNVRMNLAQDYAQNLRYETTGRRF